MNRLLERATQDLERHNDPPNASAEKALQNYRERVDAQYQLLAEVLRLASQPENRDEHGYPKANVSHLGMFLTNQIMTNVINGRLPQSIEDLYFRKGRPGLKALQVRAIESVVRYLAAVDAGLIPKKGAIDRIADQFEVTKRTVRKWASERQDDRIRIARDFADLEQRNPAKAELLADKLVRHMMENGQSYRGSRHGRTRNLKKRN